MRLPIHNRSWRCVLARHKTHIAARNIPVGPSPAPFLNGRHSPRAESIKKPSDRTVLRLSKAWRARVFRTVRSLESSGGTYSSLDPSGTAYSDDTLRFDSSSQQRSLDVQSFLNHQRSLRAADRPQRPPVQLCMRLLAWLLTPAPR